MPVRLSAAIVVVATALVLLTAARGSGPPNLQSQLPNLLPMKESADIAAAAYRAELEPSYRKRDLGFDFDGTKPNQHFFTWMIIPTWGQGVSFFGVDRRTADVWDYLGCRLIKSDELTAIQSRFRQRYHIPLWRVRQIEKEGFPGEDC